MKKKKGLYRVASMRLLNVPILFLSWITGIKVKPKEVSQPEKFLLFIGFILLCFGFYRLLSHLVCNGLVHQLLFTEYEIFMMDQKFV